MRRRVALLAVAFVPHAVERPGKIAGLAVDGSVAYTWGEEAMRSDLLGGKSRVIARGSFGAAGCRFGGGLVLTEGAALVEYSAGRRRIIEPAIDTPDVIAASLFGRRGVLVVHRGIQVRFYEAPAWKVRDIYSFYSPSRQGGLFLSDIDGDGRTDIFCGNYWIQSPPSFELPWRLFAIDTWNETDRSAVLALTYIGTKLAVMQREMPEARLAWFDKPADPKQLWSERRLPAKLDRPTSLGAADFNRDGRPDLMICEKKLAVWLDGEPRPQILGDCAVAAVADVNGDDRPDIVSAAAGRLSWWEAK